MSNAKKWIPFLLIAALLLAAVPGMAQMGATKFGKFSSENLRGEEENTPVTEAIFADADITLVNYWATWCGPCIAELPDLGQLFELSEGRAQVVGVLLDGLDARGRKDNAVIKAMHVLLDDAEAEYPVVLPDEWLSRLGSLVMSIPTTFLVDRDGNVVQTVIGSRTAEQWLDIVDKALAE